MSDHKPLIGIALMVGAASTNAVKDGFAKLLAPHFLPAQMVWMQFVVALLVLLPFLLARGGPRDLWPRPFGLNLLRAFYLIAILVLFYWSLRFIPLADATAMIFMAPLVVTALSPLLLGEKVGPRRWTAVTVGFIGVLIILRPEFGGSRIGYFIALGAGFALGLFYISNRQLAGRSSSLAGVVHTLLFCVIATTPVAPFVWRMPAAHDWLLFAPFVVLSLAGLVMNVSAFVFAPASVLAPLLYLQIIGSVIFGDLVFHTLPDDATWLGIGLVVTAGLYIAWRERKGPSVEPVTV